jgi:hypothetical protein
MKVGETLQGISSGASADFEPAVDKIDYDVPRG